MVRKARLKRGYLQSSDKALKIVLPLFTKKEFLGCKIFKDILETEEKKNGNGPEKKPLKIKWFYRMRKKHKMWCVGFEF